MRYLILSDIHANWEALEAVLRDAGGSFDQILCLGDVVGYGADPNAVTEWTRDYVKAIVRGNHDKVASGSEDISWFNPIAQRLKRAGFDLARDEKRTAAAREQLVEYFAGKRRSFDLPVVRRGSDFQQAVWEKLSRIPFGETRTYGEVAQAIGQPGEAEQVGSACAANDLLLVVACHRVVGANGALTGYGGGLELKERLLRLEGGLV